MFDLRRPPDGAPLNDAYMLVERLSDGSRLHDLFRAPSNAEAIARAEDVIEGRPAELWRRDQLICSWNPPAGAGRAPVRREVQVMDDA